MQKLRNRHTPVITRSSLQRVGSRSSTANKYILCNKLLIHAINKCTRGMNSLPRLIRQSKLLVTCNLKQRSLLRNLSASQVRLDKHDCQILIVGGGCGGCAMAAKFSSHLGENKVIVLEPADIHYYQPMFTLIGGGMKRLEHSRKYMRDVLPKNAKWLQERAVEFDPDNNVVRTSNGNSIKYDMLLIATGLQLNYEKIPGLLDALAIPNSKVCSIYSPVYVESVFDNLCNIRDGNAIFTLPASPIKCAGAPQKIAYIAEHFFRKMSKRDNINVIYNTALPVLFGVEHYANALWPIVKRRNISVNLNHNLVEVKPNQNVAVFENLKNPGELFEETYSMLHVVPPMSTPNELSACKQLVDGAGFVDVNKDTLQHTKYKNVFAIGDSANTPNSKTAAATAAQSPVVFHNMLSVMKGKKLNEVYDGYASCPLVTGYSTCMLAEFDYNLQPLETFPFAQNKDRYSMFIMKKDLMPTLYWKVMMNGYWNGPALMRKMLSIFKSKSVKT